MLDYESNGQVAKLGCKLVSVSLGLCDVRQMRVLDQGKIQCTGYTARPLRLKVM